MFKRLLLTLFIIFITQTILFSQNTCENLNQNECTETILCNWTVVSTPNGLFEMCVENDNWDDDDLCSQFPLDMCETMPL